ncbi:hypothetical protein F3157_21485 [Virgibacillus dakarensis]|nr:hypothetical protein [Virgibacillus dakarensis]
MISTYFVIIVTFQTPKTFEEKVKKALVLYSNGGENDVLAPEWEETKQAFLKAIQELREVAASPEKVAFHHIPFLKKFAKAYQALDRAFSAVQVYSEFDESQLGSIFSIQFKEIENYQGKYHNALEVIKSEKNNDPSERVEIDIEYELESIKAL